MPGTETGQLVARGSWLGRLALGRSAASLLTLGDEDASGAGDSCSEKNEAERGDTTGQLRSSGDQV